MKELLDDAIGLWDECPSSPPRFPRAYSTAEQAEREAEFDRLIASIQLEVQRIPRTRTERCAARERIARAFVRFATASSDLDQDQAGLLFGDGFSSIGTALAREARRFDPAVSTDDVFQASRNAWTACGLQKLFGKPMRLTPSIFAYSMLYPYTDNYLDDPHTSREDKAGFNGRFGRRLQGEPVEPANDREAAIWRLIERIESEHDRRGAPQVFASLLAIHRAQADSMRLMRGGPTALPVDVLRVVFAKGGSSVLADGFLAAGALTEPEARFVFAWGVALQLADDLQDVVQDRAAGVLTLFTQAAGREPLDALTNRTVHFALKVLSWLEGVGVLDSGPLKQLIARSSVSLLVRAAGEARSLYSRTYIEELERHSSLRFAFLDERRQRLAKNGGIMAKLFEAFLAGDEDEPAFPVLPNSMLPRF